MTARGIMTALLATDGSRCGAGAAVLCPRYGNITERNTGIAIPATQSFTREIMNEVEKAITAVGAIIEISRFIFTKMTEEGYSYDEAFQTAQKYILQTLKNDGGNEEE